MRWKPYLLTLSQELETRSWVLGGKPTIITLLKEHSNRMTHNDIFMPIHKYIVQLSSENFFQYMTINTESRNQSTFRELEILGNSALNGITLLQHSPKNSDIYGEDSMETF